MLVVLVACVVVAVLEGVSDEVSVTLDGVVAVVTTVVEEEVTGVESASVSGRPVSSGSFGVVERHPIRNSVRRA